MQTSIFSRLMVLLVLLFTTHLVWADADKEAEWERRAQYVLSLLDDGYYKEGLIEAKSLLQYAKNNFDSGSIYLAATQNIIGRLNKEEKNFKKSELAYLNAINTASKLDDFDAQMSYKNNLAILYEKMGNIKESEKIFLSIYSYRKKNIQLNLKSFINSANSLGVFYNRNKEKEKSIKYYKEALHEINDNEIHKKFYYYVFYNVGLYYKALGDFKKSQQYLEESLALAMQAYGDQHIEVATIYYALADNYIETNQYTQAKPLYEQALAIRETVFGSQHELVADCILGLADVHRATGSAKQAHSLYRKAVRIYKRSLGNSSAPMAVALNSWGVLYSQENNFEQAAALQTQALAMHQQHSDDQDYTSIIALNLGKAQTETQDFEQAEINLNKALTLRRQLKQSNRQIKPVNDALAALYQASGQQVKAKARQ